VQWIHWVTPEVLARELSRHHVCLGIFGTTDKASRVLPNKIYQGMATGCAIVSGATAAQARVFGSAAILVPPGEARPLADVLRDLSKDRDEVARARERALTLARAFTPGSVVAPLHRALLERAGPPGTRGG
jgi:hypothetical protein